jgi:muramoyltetrapeptide carboxypeptidase
MNNRNYSRRVFLRNSGVAALAALVSHRVRALDGSASPLKPPRLKPGDTVGLINPAGALYEKSDLEIVKEIVVALGLKYIIGNHALDRYGYLAGQDEDRAADVNDMFSDSSVNCILAVRGGWGCNRILPLLDYDLIRRNPKVVLGYSDITSLLLALYARCNLVTFHGPVGISTWNRFSLDYFNRILFEGESVVMRNPVGNADNLVQTKDRLFTITSGVARGRLVGGNLSVLTAMVGSRYLPDWRGAILFLEDDGEKIYRIDRMFTQLKLAGILDQVSGLVFGKCTHCEPGEGYGSLTLEEVLNDHVHPLSIPAWSGAMIGHIEDKFTLPVGVQVEIDAEQGTIRMLEGAVS